VTPTDALLAGLLIFVLASAVATALARTLLSTLSAFAAYSLGLAMVWVLFRAPDVALTEAAVGAGVTTALLLLVVRRASGNSVVAASETRERRSAFARVRPRSVAVAALVTVGILLTVPALPAVGDPESPSFGPVTDYYLTDAADRGIDNAVTAILVVYRGFDTFGEIAVVFAAAVAVLAVLNLEGPL
jgi:multicomponent Na+:H+ antiporter subunit B